MFDGQFFIGVGAGVLLVLLASSPILGSKLESVQDVGPETVRIPYGFFLTVTPEEVILVRQGEERRWAR